MKILLVEDSLISSYVISNMLTVLGYEADMVENGQQALESLEQERYDLVFMDCDMPVLDGYATTKEIRRREQVQGKPAVIIIALSAHVTAEHGQECKAAGMNDYLVKPIHLNTLRLVLESWTNRTMNMPEPVTEAIAPSLDYQILKQLKEVMGYEITKQLMQNFMACMPQQLMALQRLVTSEEREALRRKAHQFKGESVQFGAARVGEICKEMEILAQEGTLEVLRACLTKLETELTHVREALIRVTENDA